VDHDYFSFFGLHIHLFNISLPVIEIWANNYMEVSGLGGLHGYRIHIQATRFPAQIRSRNKAIRCLGGDKRTGFLKLGAASEGLPLLCRDIDPGRGSVFPLGAGCGNFPPTGNAIFPE